MKENPFDLACPHCGSKNVTITYGVRNSIFDRLLNVGNLPKGPVTVTCKDCGKTTKTAIYAN